MRGFWQDFRYAVRMLGKNRGITVVAVLTLALGIGANTAIFSVVNAVLLRPLPYRDPDRLVVLSEETKQLPGMSVSYPNFLDWRGQNRVFEQIAAFQPEIFNLTGEREPERIRGRNVSGKFFTMLGVKPIAGRDFLPEEDKPGAHPVVIASYGFWQTRFGGDPNFVGRALTLNGEKLTVIGILPRSFRFYYGQPDLYAPIGRAADQMTDRGQHPSIYVLARLKRGVTLGEARTDMNAIADQLAKQYPKTNAGHQIGVVTMYKDILGDIQPVLYLLLAAVGFVLLIACANVANLLLARATARAKEIAIRRALGASGPRVFQQLLTESVLLAIVGGSLGLLLAEWGTDALLALIPASVPRMQEVHMDSTLLLFTLVVSVLTGLLFGLAPAWQAARANVNDTLKEGMRGTSGHRHVVRGVLVFAEVALVFVLLVGAGLAARSFIRLEAVKPGFDPQNILTMQMLLPASKYADDAKVAAFYEQLLPRVQALPGARYAGMTTPLPLSGEGWQTDVMIEGRPVPAPNEFPNSDYQTIRGDYFPAMGIPLLRGRTFYENDREKTEPVAIINETMARRFWPGEDPVGRRFCTCNADRREPWRTVVGVVGDVKQYGLDREQKTQFYVPHNQRPLRYASLTIKTEGDPLQMASAVREAVQSFDADEPVYNVRTMEQLLTDSSASWRLSMLLLGVFGAVALVLAAVGIYGVMAYAVTQRTQEIGIRMALGAQRANVLRMVVKQGMSLVLLGAGCGIAVAVLLTQLMKSLLFGVSAIDPVTFALVTMLLGAVAFAACYIPARRATQVNPIIALRYE